LDVVKLYQGPLFASPEVALIGSWTSLYFS